MRLRTAALVALILLGIHTNPQAAAMSQPDDDLKAAVVLSFLRYTDWNSAPAQDALTVGVVGRPDFGRELRRAFEGKTIGPRHLAIIDSPDGSCTGCQILYIASDRRTDVQRFLAASGSAHTLTIGETAHFLDWGGAINLVTVDGHMSFEVNLGAVNRTGCSISSKLLRFGQVIGVKGDRP